jgi:hypothetical protein
MVYKYGKKLKEDKKTIRRYLAGFAASLAILAGAAGPALAASNDYCGSSANGCDAAAAAGAQCGSGAASGAFGAFGPGNDWRGGANVPATGESNSSVCGNRPAQSF